jgi:hypothetical protein
MNLFNIFESLTEIDNLASFVTISVTALGAISLFIANMGRYFQAKKFGIPIRAIHQANISDSTDLLVVLVGALGFGIFGPVIMLSVDMNWWVRFILVFIAFTLGLFSTKSAARIEKSKKVKRDGEEYIIMQDISPVFLPCFALVITIAYMRLHYVYYVIDAGHPSSFFATLGTTVAVIAQIIYLLLLSILLVANLYSRMFGFEDVMITVINEQHYLVFMRHNLDKWILLPCDIETQVNYLDKKKSISSDIKTALFEKGNFIIKDLANLPGPIVRCKDFYVVQKGQRKQDDVEVQKKS